MSLLGAALLTTRACLMPCAVGTDVSRVVDIFNVAAGTWSTAALSQARYWFAATSLPNAGVAIFAGGLGTSFDLCCSYCRMGIGVKRMRELVECGCVDSYHVQRVAFPFLMLWTFSHPAPPPPLPHQQRPLRYQQLLPQPPPPPPLPVTLPLPPPPSLPHQQLRPALREPGALQPSARLGIILQPRRCRMPESRSSPEAHFVRLVMLV